MVRGFGHSPDSVFFWTHGSQLHHRCVGRYQACCRKQLRCHRQGVDTECWLYLDVDQLFLYFVLRIGNAQADQIDQL